MAEAELGNAVELDDQLRSVLDQAVSRLNELWKSVSCPDLAPLLPQVGHLYRRPVLVELIKEDQEHRWKTGLVKPLESYLIEWPEVQQEPSIRAKLLEAELQTRAAFGVLPSINELQGRFPELSVELLNDLLHAASQLTTPVALGSGRLKVRCASCETRMEVALDTQLTILACASCGSPIRIVIDSDDRELPPWISTIDGFEVLGRVGMGSYGTVWMARDKELDRTVAIKIARQSHMTAEEQERFLREARAAAQLRHPNIVSIHEVGRDGDLIYIVSEFIYGLTLGQWSNRHPIGSRAAAELCAVIAEALHHAHERGVVHRDVKPSNVMIDGEGAPHVMDFGLARRDYGEVTMTRDGQVLGTLAYMSPEQASGKSHLADRRSDVYSVGVILFQLLTSKLPFHYDAMITYRIVHEEPTRLRQITPSIPRNLETITLKCLEKDPGRRYQTAKELAADLRCFLSGEPITARPVGRIGRGWKWAKRKPAHAALMVLLALLTVPLFQLLSSDHSLVAYYPFNGDTDDHSGNGNHGQFHRDRFAEAAVFTDDRFGTPKSACLLAHDGSYIDLFPANHVPASITFAAWVRPDVSGRQLWGSIDDADGGKDGYFADLRDDTPYLAYAVANIDKGEVQGPYGKIETGKWSHVAYTVSADGTVNLFVGGESVKSGHLKASASAHDGRFMVGKAIKSQNDHSFLGAIDDVRIYNRALTEDEVLRLAGKFQMPRLAILLLGVVLLFGIAWLLQRQRSNLGSLREVTSP
jgi:serine/threonine protein kinase